MVGKYVWNVARKADNLWVKWVDHLYVKGRNWWLYNPSSSASWFWRQICKAKKELQNGFETKNWIDNGYTAKRAYNWLRGPGVEVNWDSWV